MSWFDNFRKSVSAIVRIHSHMDVEAAAENIKSNIFFRGPNVYILICAIVIASLGLNVNSIPVIIGAMLVSPLMGPIVGFGMSLGTNDADLMRASLRNLAVMVLISIVASTLYFLLTPLRLENPTELLARTNPTIYDVMIAFFGGVAGILETSRRDKGTVLSGVAIATALMPPLCTIGFGLSQLNLHYALGAFYLFAINSVFIALASFLGVRYLRFPVKTDGNASKQRRIRLSMLVALVIVVIPSIVSAVSLIRQNNFERHVEAYVKNVRLAGGPYVYDYKIDHSASPSQLELFIAGEQLDNAGREILYGMADEYNILRGQLRFNEDLAGSMGSQVNEKLFNQTLTNYEERRRQQDSVIKAYEAEIERFKSVEIDARQLSDEIRSQYPSVNSITLAHGDVVDDGGASQPVVVAVIEGGESLSASEVEKVSRWLSVRLGGRKTQVIVK